MSYVTLCKLLYVKCNSSQAAQSGLIIYNADGLVILRSVHHNQSHIKCYVWAGSIWSYLRTAFMPRVAV